FIGASAGVAPADPLLGPAPPVTLGADSLTLLRSGEATFPRIRALLDTAHSVIHVEMYEFARHDLEQSIVAAHRRGVEITVIDDPTEASSGGPAAPPRGGGRADIG